MRVPATPETVEGVALTEGQRMRLSRLIACIWACDPRQTASGAVDYAERCFLETVRREGAAFEDLGRLVIGGRVVRMASAESAAAAAQ